MKKFSKESMQQFMLMHAEKLILGACLAATGLFVWMSMGGEEKSASAKTPSDLLKQANSAETYINRDNWAGERGLEQFREGKVGAKDQIASTQPVDGSKFMIDIIGPPVETLAPRKDPMIVAPEQLIAHRFVTGVHLDLPGFTSPASEFIAAPASSDDEGNGGGFGGFQGGGDDYGDDYDTGGSSTRTEGLHEDYLPLERSNIFNDVNAQTITGIRPAGLGISDKIVTNVRDVVCVTAVVDYQKQTVAFEQAFADSIAYNAKRDRPVYQCLQVQRRETAGQADWVDITENVTYKFARLNPLKPMPFQVDGSAPEVISPDNFDPILSQSIPAFAQFDYQKVASHPALKTLRQFPAWKAPDKNTILNDQDPVDDIFDRQNSEDEMDLGGPGDDGINSLRNGTETELYKEAIVSRKQGGQYRLVRFFDLQPPKGKAVEYRVRVWVGDPNQLDPTEGFKKNRGMQLQVAEPGERLGRDDEVVRFAASSRDGMGGSMDEMDQYEDDTSLDGGDRREVVVDVQKTMLTPPARKRVTAGTELEVMDEGLQGLAKELAKWEAKKSSSRQNNDKDKPKLAPFHVAEYSDDGQLEQIELPPSPGQYAYIRYLRFARPSAWSETVRVDKALPNADVLAGTTVRKRAASVELGGRVVQFDQVEPSIKVVVSHWVSSLGAKLPAERDAYVGETMNFNDQAYVTHPISWQVLVPEIKGEESMKKYTMPFRSNETIVDAFFGDTQELPNDKRLSMELATEILTMDANGNLKVSNQFAAEKDYRNELAMPDDSRFYGRAKRQKAKKDEYEGDDYGDDY